MIARRRTGRAIRRSNREGVHEGGSAERWLVSYSDLITLLFALFVVLYAMSQADLKKFKKVSEGMKRAFSGDTARESPPVGSASGVGAGEGATSVSGVMLAGDSELLEIRRLLEEATEFDASIAGTGLETRLGKATELRWIIIDSYLEGETEPAMDFRPLLRRVAEVLERFPQRPIRWEGHADSGEVSDGDSATRRLFQISLDRALAVDRFMRQQWRENGRRGDSEVAAYGASRPLRQDEVRSSWTRARNRRVELVVMPRRKS